jgi:hypothetical protein
MDFAELDISTSYSLAYTLFVEARAAHTGKIAADIVSEITAETFEIRLRELHARYINRELSLLRFADLLGVPVAHLHPILDAAGLALRSARPRFCNL